MAGWPWTRRAGEPRWAGTGAGIGARRPGPAPTGQVELFENDGFGGRVLPINGSAGNFPNEFNDRASSMIIHNGYWEACENIGFGGRCQVFGPGRYANLGSNDEPHQQHSPCRCASDPAAQAAAGAAARARCSTSTRTCPDA